MSTKSRNANKRAWTQGLALLAGCYATLIGAVQQVSPEIILFRATIVSVVVLVLSRFFLNAVRNLTQGESQS